MFGGLNKKSYVDNVQKIKQRKPDNVWQIRQRTPDNV